MSTLARLQESRDNPPDTEKSNAHKPPAVLQTMRSVLSRPRRLDATVEEKWLRRWLGQHRSAFMRRLAELEKMAAAYDRALCLAELELKMQRAINEARLKERPIFCARCTHLGITIAGCKDCEQLQRARSAALAHT
jgi:hypothetical protein